MMDEDLLLIHELVDSDDDVRIEADLFFSDLQAQQSRSLFGILHSQQRRDRIDLSKEFSEDVSGGGCLRSSNKFPADIQQETSSSLSDTLSSSEEDFIRLFRVKHALAEHIITTVKNSPISYPDLKISPKDQTLAVLFFLGQETMGIEDVCNRFKINAVTFNCILNRVTDAVYSLSPKEICLPNETQKQCTKAYYAQHKGLQGVIGCIDTLPILLSKEEEKSASSSHELVILQAVVNQNKEFTHIYVSNTAKTDEEILTMSSLYEELPSICSEKEYLLGGATYPCLEHLVSPYPDLDDLCGDRIFFNLSVAACMQTTDDAFALLTQRFGRLVNLKLPDTAIAHQLIIACCVLHNMAGNDDLANINETPVSRDKATEEYSRINSTLPFIHSEEGLKLRDSVCDKLSSE